MTQGFNISNFKSIISEKGVLSPNKFLFRCSLPIVLQNEVFLDNKSIKSTHRYLEYWCESTTVPGIGYASYEVRRYGYGGVEKRPIQSQYNDVNCTFYSDGKGDNWTFFRKWSSGIIQNNGSRGVNVPHATGSRSEMGRMQQLNSYQYEISYKQDYVTDIEIIQFDNTGKAVKTIILRDAFPILVGEYSTSWADTNNIVKFPVLFTFTDWYLANEDITNTIINYR